MRLDKYLKVSRIIKRRTVAKEACESGRVIVNGKVAKPSTEIKEGDVIEIIYANNSLKAKILNVKNYVKKEDVQNMYKIIAETKDVK
ncbi:RNA-binding S4 domain-containing protein [Clostridium sp. MT-14]|jgi:ribosomal 50S subunit-recycling heat shock protein|uniref:RQC P-site tRNA stabilizing factor n=1 Tax=Clostridium aromativorans TaxID=2836848 RepID=A0ABS8N4E4_9CLOT|nr:MULTISPECIES: RNA-binding S4 domain-containing protein [Clostridium]KAA8671192.1 RNA-binding S4 domain-containing protein [Clostridium sp. HV4-5-A1G]MCC9294541.1 RNA-binding S4 domain-containing protein [Clostridium aromativorans]CAB1254683.1 ribosomal RNA binding protein involved in 50S recycling; heat shock protein [Clostridiaceae bacterium BL-3]